MKSFVKTTHGKCSQGSNLRVSDERPQQSHVRRSRTDMLDRTMDSWTRKVTFSFRLVVWSLWIVQHVKILKNDQKGNSKIKRNTITFHCAKLEKNLSDKGTFSAVCFLLEPLLIQTNLLCNHSITPLFSSDNGLSPGLLKRLTADLRADTGEARCVDKLSREQDDLQREPRPFLFFHVPGEQEAKLEVSPPADSRVGGDSGVGGKPDALPPLIAAAIWSGLSSDRRSSIILSDR